MATLTQSYTTVDNLLRIIPAVGSISTVTSSTLAYFIGLTEAEMNAHLAKMYTLPLTVKSPLLEMICNDIALYNIMAKRVFTSEQINKSEWPNRFKAASELLNQIADGSVPLLSETNAVIAKAAGSGVWSNNMNYTPTFNEDGDIESTIDQDKLTDIEDSRL